MKRKYSIKEQVQPIVEDFQAEYRITKDSLKGEPARVGIQAEVPSKFSPAWVVANAKDAPGYKMELIHRIRLGVKKADWKQLIYSIGSTEVEFENILPISISSMQKKAVYGRETSERIYELAQLFGLGMRCSTQKKTSKSGWSHPQEPSETKLLSTCSIAALVLI
jgi:hypothetical protein